MSRDGVTVEPKTNDTLAAKLLLYGDECLADGCLPQAESLFQQVWSLASTHNQAIADAAAWRIGWLALQRQAYGEARGWFQHIRDYPAQTASLWPVLSSKLEALCAIAGCAADHPNDSRVASPPNDHARAPLTIYTLGRFEVQRHQRVVPLSTAHQSSVIVRYLLTRPHYSALKDELMELMWPDTLTAKAAHNLHVAISTVRRLVDGGDRHCLLYEGGHYTLNPHAVLTYDCTEFRSLVDQAEQHRICGRSEQAATTYRQSLAWYKGDFYVASDDGLWAMAERERLLTQYLSVLDQFGALLMEQRSFEAAIDVYQRLIERDEYREDGHYYLMQCYWQLGRRKAALQQYEHCATLLDHDLGLKPMEHLTNFYAAMLSTETTSLDSFNVGK